MKKKDYYHILSFRSAQITSPVTAFVLTVLLYAGPSLLSAQETDRMPAASPDGIAADDVFTLRGQFRDFFLYYPVENYSVTGDEKKLVSDLKRLRLSPQLNFSDKVIIHMDYDNEIISGSYLKSREFNEFWRPPEYNDLLQMSREPSYDRDLYYRTKIHRLYAKITAGDFTVTAGRQMVRFGSGRLWNPLDILNPVSPTSIEGAEEQKGIDALRGEYYLNETTEIGLVLDQKRYRDRGGIDDLSTDSTNILGRFKITLGKTELAGLGGRVSHRRVGGIDISTILFDGMLRGSVLYSDPEEGNGFIQAGAGYEYNFAMGLYLLAEYFYNQDGLNFNRDLKEQYLYSKIYGSTEEGYRALSNRFLTYNRHYGACALGYDLTPLLRGDLFVIYDFQGRGLFFNPSLKYNAFQNIDVSIGIMRAHVFDDAAKSSDFGDFDDMGLVYGSLVWYF